MRTTYRSTGCLLVALVLGAAACQSGGGGARGSRAEKPPWRAAQPSEKKAPANQTLAELHASLRDPELVARIGVVEELGRRAASSDEAGGALVEALGDAEPLVRRFAAGGLANLKSPSAPACLALARLLRDPDNDPRESAARTLATLGPHVPDAALSEVGGALAAAVGDADETVRTSVVEALGALGARVARAVPSTLSSLERALADPNERVRAASAEAAGQLGSGVKGVLTLLVKALADPVHDVRKYAVIALEKMGSDAAPATQAIARLLHGQEIYLRVFAADALTAIGTGARAALPDLRALVARGFKELESSKEVEAGQLPEAVARAIRALEGKGAKKRTKTP